MRKLYDILMVALLAMAAVSCSKDSYTEYDPEKAVAPVIAELGSETYTLAEDAVFAKMTFTPADFGIPVAVRYTMYVDVKGNDMASKKQVGMVTSPATEIEVGGKDLNNALMALNCEPEVAVDVEFSLRAEWMGESNPVGIELNSNVVSAKVIPYNAVREYAKVYVIGSYCGWNHGNSIFLFNFDEDDNIYEGVIDFGEDHSANEFKVTGADNWDNGNWGTKSGDSTPAESSQIQLWNDGGSGNISIYKEKRYYHLAFSKNTEILSKNMSFDKVGLIGLNGDWDNDVVMTFDAADQCFYAEIDLPADTEFKFRMDSEWALNYGGSLDNLTQGGDNIKISAGKYKVCLNLNNADSVTATVTAL